MEAENLHAFVEVEQAFSKVVQAEEFFVSAVDFVDGDARLFHLVIECLAEARANVQQGKEAGRIEAAAVSQAGAN